MITRAIVEDIDYNKSKVKVRIPLYNNIKSAQQFTPDRDLSWASILWIPGISINYQPGDVVVVGFEDEDIGKPIILGYLKLSRDGQQIKGTDRVEIAVKQVQVEESFTAPIDTQIGAVTYEDLFNVTKRGAD